MQFDQLRRRDFFTLLSGAAVTSPLSARAQQPAMPELGFLDPRSPGTMENLLRAFRQGLKDTSYVDGENVAIAYRFADGQFDRLPELAALPRAAICALAIDPCSTRTVGRGLRDAGRDTI
jgi:putative ABC transport system substrate-binding protein